MLDRDAPEFGYLSNRVPIFEFHNRVFDKLS